VLALLGTAGETHRGSDRAVHLDHVDAAGAGMERVDVLGDDRLHEPAPFELREGVVAGVRLGLEQRVDARPVEAPDVLRIAEERLDRRDLEGIDLGPDPFR
jgi:hypothetical protein